MELPNGPIEVLYNPPASLVTFPDYIHAGPDGIYWNRCLDDRDTHQLWHSGLQGQDPEMLVELDRHAPGHQIKVHDGHIYWNDPTYGSISRCDLNGDNVEVVISGYGGQSDELIWDFDIYGGRFYWTNFTGSSTGPYLNSCAVDGSDYRRVRLADATRPISIEVCEGQFYIADTPNDAYSGSIRRYSVDGSSYEVLTGAVFI